MNEEHAWSIEDLSWEQCAGGGQGPSEGQCDYCIKVRVKVRMSAAGQSLVRHNKKVKSA